MKFLITEKPHSNQGDYYWNIRVDISGIPYDSPSSPADRSGLELGVDVYSPCKVVDGMRRCRVNYFRQLEKEGKLDDSLKQTLDELEVNLVGGNKLSELLDRVLIRDREQIFNDNMGY